MVSTTWVRRLAVAAAAAGIAFGAGQAFAASLGSGTARFGATSAIVEACGTGLTFTYTTTFDAGISGYAVNGIELSHIPAGCLNKNLTATFLDENHDAAGTAVGAALPAAGTTQTIPIDPSANTIAAGQVSGVSVVVS
jgi:hypothetical protein